MTPAEAPGRQSHVSEAREGMAPAVQAVMIYFSQCAEQCLKYTDDVRRVAIGGVLEPQIIDFPKISAIVAQLGEEMKAKLKSSALKGRTTPALMTKAYGHALANNTNGLNMLCQLIDGTPLDDITRGIIEVSCANLEAEYQGSMQLFQQANLFSDKDEDHLTDEKLKDIIKCEKLTIENPQKKELYTFSTILAIITQEIATNVGKYGENLIVQVNFGQHGVDFLFTNNIKEADSKVFTTRTGTGLIKGSISVLRGKLHKMKKEGGMFITHFTIPYNSLPQ